MSEAEDKPFSESFHEEVGDEVVDTLLGYRRDDEPLSETLDRVFEAFVPHSIHVDDPEDVDGETRLIHERWDDEDGVVGSYLYDTKGEYIRAHGAGWNSQQSEVHGIPRDEVTVTVDHGDPALELGESLVNLELSIVVADEDARCGNTEVETTTSVDGNEMGTWWVVEPEDADQEYPRLNITPWYDSGIGENDADSDETAGGLREVCTDSECDWSETWDGGSAADDPGVQHAKDTGHQVKTTVQAGDDDEESSWEDEREPLAVARYRGRLVAEAYTETIVEHWQEATDYDVSLTEQGEEVLDK